VRRPGRRPETVWGVGEGLNSLHPPKIARPSDPAPVGLEWLVGEPRLPAAARTVSDRARACHSRPIPCRWSLNTPSPTERWSPLPPTSQHRFSPGCSRRLLSRSTARCGRRKAPNFLALSRAVSAAFFWPRLGLTTLGPSRLNQSRSSARVHPLSTLRRAIGPTPSRPSHRSVTGTLWSTSTTPTGASSSGTHSCGARAIHRRGPSSTWGRGWPC
jgi:hypothetical protein